MFYFDPLYFLLLLPAIIFAGWAQLRVHSAYAEAAKIAPSSRMSGQQAAQQILSASGLGGVDIEMTGGRLSDHYDPRDKVLRLSPDIYQGHTLAALGIAAHEAGHALQDASAYPLLRMRNAIVPLASFGSSASWFIIFGGFLMSSMNLVLLGIALFSLVVIFQLVNLPVEYDASRRAKELLVSRGMISSAELPTVKKVLDAAALTYVAATLSSILTLLYYLIRSGLLGGGRD